MSGIMQIDVDEHQGLLREIARLNMELAALRPWAEIGERALREEWWKEESRIYPGRERMMVCRQCGQLIDDNHRCEVTALLAQLEAKPDA